MLVKEYKTRNSEVFNNIELSKLEKILIFINETIDYKQLGIIPEGYYNSKSKGLLLIKNMNNMHIRNAICVLAEEAYTSLRRTQAKLTDKEFLEKFELNASNRQVLDLYKELKNRI